MRYFICALIYIFSSISISNDAPESNRSVINEHMSEITLCYNSTKIKDSQFQGKVVVDWEINDLGEVGKISINKKKSKLKNTILHNCIIEKFKTWKFKPAPKGGVITVSYPFMFLQN